MSPPGQALGFGARAVHAMERDHRRLALSLVLAHRLACVRSGSPGVDEVVGDLEDEAEIAREAN